MSETDSNITEAMRLAGAAVIEDWANIVDPEALAMKVYLAMSEAA